MGELGMTKSKVIYSDVANLIAEFYHPQSDEWIEYEGKIRIKDLEHRFSNSLLSKNTY
jgi:hypothetical protein